jgi:hypothetical protein
MNSGQQNERRVKLRVVFDGKMEDTFWIRAVAPTVVPLPPEQDQIRYIYGNDRTLCVQLNFETLDLGFGILLKRFEVKGYKLSVYDSFFGESGRCVRLTTLPPSCAVVKKSGNLNFLEPSGPPRACNGTALPLPGRVMTDIRSVQTGSGTHPPSCSMGTGVKRPGREADNSSYLAPREWRYSSTSPYFFKGVYRYLFIR